MLSNGRLKKIELLLSEWARFNPIHLPWRPYGEGSCDPYGIWISEIMLQQTTVRCVTDYYLRFMKRFPSLEILASAELEAVLQMWQGLGYYRRARLLHLCVRELVYKRHGVWPRSWSGLQELPGIGPYTAGAIMVFAYNQNAPAVDTNVRRVMGRFFGLPQGVSGDRDLNKFFLKSALESPRNFFAHVMDLGRIVCQSSHADCDLCPLKQDCCAYPYAPAIKKRVRALEKQELYTTFFIYSRGDQIWMRQGSGHQKVLRDLWIPPSSPWESYDNYVVRQKTWPKRFVVEGFSITHVFSHIKLHANIVFCGEMSPFEGVLKGRWVAVSLENNKVPLSALSAKIVEIVSFWA